MQMTNNFNCKYLDARSVDESQVVSSENNADAGSGGETETSLKSQFYFNDQKVTMMLIHQSDKETLCDALG